MKVGDEVRFYNLGVVPGRDGWRFGRVIGTHTDNVGINPTHLEWATVRFTDGVDFPLPQFRLEVLECSRS